MLTFKTNKKLHWINELKSWLWTFALAAFLYFSLKYFLSFNKDNLIVGVFVILLIKLSNTLTQYHVKEIQIDEQNNQLMLILNSKISGEIIKKYELGIVTSELIRNSGLTKYLSSTFTLKVFLKSKDTFIISNRYGFTLDTLTSVNNTLKSIKYSSLTL